MAKRASETTFFEVCWSFLGYPSDACHEMARFQALCNSVAPEDFELWNMDLPKYMSSLKFGIEVNTRFLQALPVPDVCGASLTRQQAQAIFQMPPDHRVAGRNASKVRTTLRQFVRDWAVEG